MIERVRNFLKKVMMYIARPYMRILPGQLAFFFVVSLIPLIALVGTIAGCISGRSESYLRFCFAFRCDR